MQKLKVASNEAGQRLDKLLSKYLSQAGKGFLYKMMRKKNITLNGKKCDGSERVEEGDEISLFLADETIEKFSAPLPELAALGKEKDRNFSSCNAVPDCFCHNLSRCCHNQFFV